MKNLTAVAGKTLTTIGLCLALGGAAAAAPAESARMQRAKDLMSEDRWIAAIPVLEAAAADATEPGRDEALFWLAHSQNRAGDLADSVESIRLLQRLYPKSRWSAPAYSLLIELAQKLGRRDVLWWTATPPPPPPAPPEVAPPASAARVRRPFAPPPMPPAPPAAPAPPAPPSAAPAAAPFPPPPPSPPPPPAWIPKAYLPDADARVQALGQLIHTDAKRVVPMLHAIALENVNPAAARRAVFVLAQSRSSEALSTLLDLVKKGPDPVRVVAARELGRFGGERAGKTLLQVYWTANRRVRQQVVSSLGERADVPALLEIAQREQDRSIRSTAIVMLGRAGGHQALRTMYSKASPDIRLAIVTGLSIVRDDEGLLRIARDEKDPQVRREALRVLRLLDTPRARAYLEKTR